MSVLDTDQLKSKAAGTFAKMLHLSARKRNENGLAIFIDQLQQILAKFQGLGEYSHWQKCCFHSLTYSRQNQNEVEGDEQLREI